MLFVFCGQRSVFVVIGLVVIGTVVTVFLDIAISSTTGYWNHACTSSTPCSVGAGDCDNASECRTGTSTKTQQKNPKFKKAVHQLSKLIR